MKDLVTVRPLRPREKIKLPRLKRQRRNTVNSKHARIVLLSAGHVANRRIATVVDCSVQWVRQVIHRFNAQGIDGITWYPWFQVRSERVFTADIRERIVEVALCSPIGLIGRSPWSLPKLRQYLVEQKIIAHISIHWLGEILRRYKVRSPDHDLEGIDRPVVCPEIPGDSTLVPPSSRQRSALVHRRIRSAQPPATAWPLLQGAEQARQARAGHVQPPQRHPTLPGLLRRGDRPTLRPVHRAQEG